MTLDVMDRVEYTVLYCSMYTACVLFIYSCAPRTDDEIYDAVGLKAEPMPDRLAA